MPDASTFLLFAAASLALLFMPGPVVLYTIARSIDQGRRAGLASVAAAGVGDLCQVLAATLGLSAFFLSSRLAYDVVRYAGAAYLIYLGMRTLVRPVPESDPASVAAQPLRKIFSQGVVVSVLNPKTTLFFFAFLPQFATPERGSIAVQILLLGLTFVVLGVMTNTLYALVASSASQWLKHNRLFHKLQKYISGAIYLLLGLLAGFNLT